MAAWLNNVQARRISGDVHEIHISGYGPANVGPYNELRRFIGSGSGLECHHIVAIEHLRMFNSGYNANNAPSVAIPSTLHRRLLSPRIGAEQTYVGGRPRDGKAAAAKKEILDLYRQVYTWHTSFAELYRIVQNLIR